MKLDEVKTLARSLMDKHGLIQWRLSLVSAKSWAGQCVYGQWNLNPRYSWGRIDLSIEHMEAFDEPEVRETILHEIAHALTEKRGHGKEWKAVARRIGSTAKRTVSHDAPTIKSRYKAVWPNGHEFARHRLTESLKHSSCSGCTKKFDSRFMFDIYDNGVLVHRRSSHSGSIVTSAPAVQAKPAPVPSAPMSAEEWARDHSPTLLKLLQGIK